MAAKHGEGLSESVLNRSWWGNSSSGIREYVNTIQSDINQLIFNRDQLNSSTKNESDKAREILANGYFVVEHPEVPILPYLCFSHHVCLQSEEERRVFETNLDALKKTELVVEIEEEVEEDGQV